MKFCLVQGVLEVDALQTWLWDEIWWCSSPSIRGAGPVDSFSWVVLPLLRLADNRELIGLFSSLDLGLRT